MSYNSLIITSKEYILYEEKSNCSSILTPLLNDSIENIIKEINEVSLKNSNFTSIEINKKIYDAIIDNAIKNIKNMNLNNEGIIFEGKDNYSFQIINLEDNKGGNNNVTNQFSRIDLGDCEDVLRDKNNLDKNASLIILKYEKLTSISSERNLQ